MNAPVQLLAIAVDAAVVPADVGAQFSALEDAGLVRLLDVLFVQQAGDGGLDTVERVDAATMRFDGSLLTSFLTSEESALGSASWSLTDLVPSAGVVAVVLVEHLWAGGLVESLTASGAAMLDELWLSNGDREVIGRLRAARG